MQIGFEVTRELSELKKDKKYNLDVFGDAVIVRLTNRRIAIVDDGEDGYYVEFFFCDKDPDVPSCRHEASHKGKVRHTLIRMTEEALMAVEVGRKALTQVKLYVQELSTKDKLSLKFINHSNRKRLTDSVDRFELLDYNWNLIRKSDNIIAKNLISTFKGELESTIKMLKTPSESDKVKAFNSLALKFLKNLNTLKEVKESKGASESEINDLDQEIYIMSIFAPKMMSDSEILSKLESMELDKLPNIGARMGKAMKSLADLADGNDVKRLVLEHYN
jgi:hypothetical protein